MQHPIGGGAEQTEDAVMAVRTDHDQVGCFLLCHPQDFLPGSPEGNKRPDACCPEPAQHFIQVLSGRVQQVLFQFVGGGGEYNRRQSAV